MYYENNFLQATKVVQATEGSMSGGSGGAGDCASGAAPPAD